MSLGLTNLSYLQPDFTKYTSVQLAKGVWSKFRWVIPKEKRNLVAITLKQLRKKYKHVCTADATQVLARGRLLGFSRAIKRSPAEGR